MKNLAINPWQLSEKRKTGGGKRPFFLTLSLLLALVLLSNFSQTAHASCGGTTTVNKTNQLNTAIATFNNTTAGNCTFTIEFGSNITLTQDTALIDNNNDPNHLNLIINGNDYVLDGSYQHLLLRFDRANVAINDLVLSQGDKHGIYVDNRSNLTLNNSTIRFNRNDGIKNDNASLTVNNSLIHDNGDRGIYVENPNENLDQLVSISDTTIRNNGAQGVHIHEGFNSEITNSTIHINGEEGVLNGEYESKNGWLKTSDLKIVNSTFSLNTKAGIRNVAGNLEIYHATSTQNRANGILIHKWKKADTFIYNSIFANNVGRDCKRNEKNNTLEVKDSLVGRHDKCSLTHNEDGNLVGVDAQLDTLADNGGNTQTYTLASGSPAIDAVSSGTNGCGTDVATDQRGESRPQGGSCDMGAVEMTTSELSGTAVSSSLPVTNLPLILAFSGILLLGIIAVVLRQRQI